MHDQLQVGGRHIIAIRSLVFSPDFDYSTTLMARGASSFVPLDSYRQRGLVPGDNCSIDRWLMMGGLCVESWLRFQGPVRISLIATSFHNNREAHCAKRDAVHGAVAIHTTITIIIIIIIIINKNKISG